MAIQIPNPGTGNGATGDNEFVLWSKTKDNFSDQTNAASRLIGKGDGNVPEYYTETGLGGLGYGGKSAPTVVSDSEPPIGFSAHTIVSESDDTGVGNYKLRLTLGWVDDNTRGQLYMGLANANVIGFRMWARGVGYSQARVIYHTGNVTKDANGFLKGASPVVDMYDNKIGLNHDAEQQGGITFEKLGVGDYLLKGSLGFAQEGWYIETPKDANGNVLVAVVYEQLANNDLSIKTYAKRFDDETGDIVANLARPRDIPVGRFISLRLHELPKEPPVMPMDEPITEV